jgi:elongation factor P--(R)-beta-lysine ligase
LDQPFRSSACIEFLEHRAKLLKKLRNFFDEQGFMEVQTPVLSRDTVIDRHIDLLSLEMAWPESDMPNRWYLQSSPEAAMKRLLACGMQQIYQVGPVFRAGERGAHHNPEFTMAEWYRVDDDLEAGLSLLDDLTRLLLNTIPCKRMQYAQVFHNQTGLDVRVATILELAQRAVDLSVVDRLTWSDDWDDWVNLIFSTIVQPKLGHDGPVLITHFPASQAALAQLSNDDPRVAERFELFFRGVELANGYHELLDPDVLRDRNRKANADRIRDGKSALPENSFLLDAMEAGLPKMTGCALGFDRVVMLACGSQQLSDVLAFPIDRA